jgi:hypothetical protein
MAGFLSALSEAAKDSSNDTLKYFLKEQNSSRQPDRQLDETTVSIAVTFEFKMVNTRMTPRLYHLVCLIFVYTGICTGTSSALQRIDDRLVRQYPPLTWIENLAVRANGNILAVSNTSPILREFDPDTNNILFVHDFSACGNALQGITKVISDVFAVDVLTCDIVGTQTCTPGSGSVWRVDFRNCKSLNDLPEVTKVAVLPGAGLLNGMATLQPREGIILMADSLFGSIWRANIWTGEAGFLFGTQEMTATSEISSGVNGIRVAKDHLYFTNSARGTLYKIPIDPRTGMHTGDASTIASGLIGPDDFELDPQKGVAYVCDGVGKQLLEVCLQTGAIQLLLDLPGPTSARWGKSRSHGASRLFVSTSGGLQQYLDHNVTIGGAVYEVTI